MKIFKELVFKWNEEKQCLVLLSEVSEDYEGPLALCDYVNGDDEVKTHCYFVYVRNHLQADTQDWIGGIEDLINCETVLKENVAGDLSDWSEGTITAGVLAVADMDDWGEIGRLEEKPTAKNSAGQTVNLESCDEKDLSEIVEVDLKHLQVNKGNYNQLRALAKSGNVDFLFVEKALLSAATIDAIAVSNIKMRVYLEAIGNDKNVMPITAKKEVADSLTNFQIITCKTGA